MTRPRGLRLGDTVELAVEKGVYRGLGLARHEGQVVFVTRGVPGDRVRARVETVRKGYVRARPDAVLAPSPDRRDPPCPLFAGCGGCAYQHVAYDAQLRLKAGILRESLQRAGRPWEEPIEVVPSPEQGWRTRVRLHLEQRDARFRLGLYEEASHRVVDLDSCLQMSPELVGAGRALLAGFAARPHLARGVSEVALAESVDGRQRVAAIVRDGDAAGGTALSSLAGGAPWLTGLGLVAGGESGRYVGLSGEPWIENEAAGQRYRSHVLSFFQANRHLLDPFVTRVRDWTARGAPVLDLYGGVGLFALALAEGAPSVTAIEQDPRSAADAEENARRAARANVRTVRGEVGDVLAALPEQPGEEIVLDPPRAGAGPAIVRQIAARRPAGVVYVSCDPTTLGRDLAVFAAEGYEPHRLAAFDLFPDTFHLETVVRLTPRRPL
ncbi:MAG: class I SAM-dependent RNA methyltransferase [Vicinamibacteria bacterium]